MQHYRGAHGVHHGGAGAMQQQPMLHLAIEGQELQLTWHVASSHSEVRHPCVR